MIQQSLNQPNKSSLKREPEHLLSMGYDAAEVEIILTISRYLDAFTIRFDNGETQFFDFREPRLKIVNGGKA